MRCFVAVWPAPGVVEALAALPRPDFASARWTTEDQWHVTVRFFGELAPEAISGACTALAAAARSLPGPIIAKGGPGTRFLGPGLLVWPVEGLGGAAAAVAHATTGTGQAVPERPFFGHLTLARARRGADLRQARHLLAPLATSWPVTELSLVESVLHPGGARYRAVENFPLG